jgi:cytoskeletal protein CcmA (bactofilin family)
MDEEKIKILEMFQQGKISHSDTLELLAALEGSNTDAAGDIISDDAIELVQDSEIQDINPGAEILKMIDEGKLSGGMASGILPFLTGEEDKELKIHILRMIMSGKVDAGVACGMLPFLLDPGAREEKMKILRLVEKGKISAGEACGMLPFARTAGRAGYTKEEPGCSCCDEEECGEENIVVSSKREFPEDVEAESIIIHGAGRFLQDVSAERMDVTGHVEFHGDVEVDELTVSGHTTFQCDLAADAVRVAGMISVEGDLKADSLENSGTIHVKGDVELDSLQNAGMIHVDGDLSADSVQTPGVFKIEGDVVADTIAAKGELHVRGSIEADSFIAKLEKPSDADEIRCDQVEVTKLSDGSAVEGEYIFAVNRIEGSRIALEYCKVDEICGELVKIGPGCFVNCVEYEERLQVDPTATVLEQRRSN